jgi:hypothetical protein
MEEQLANCVPWLAKDRSHWDGSVREWLEQVAQRRALGQILNVVEVKARPWSMVLRVKFERATTYFKAFSLGGRFEASLLVLLARSWPERIPSLLERDDVRSWMLMADGGGSLRETDPDLQIRVLQRMLPLYAEMQLSSRNSVDELICLGLPDRRLRLLPELLDHLVAGTHLNSDEVCRKPTNL